MKTGSQRSESGSRTTRLMEGSARSLMSSDYTELYSLIYTDLYSHNLYNTCQSAYRPGHSTETALLKVVNDLFLSLNKGNISVLALLDFSSAFDTIDHTILVHRLHTDFGFTDTALQWFSSYLTDRTYIIHLLMTYNYRCLLPQIEYLSYFTLCSHV